MRDSATVERMFFSILFVRSNWNCFKGTNDVLSGVHVSRWLFGRLVFHAPWSVVAHLCHLTLCVATRLRRWRRMLLLRDGWFVAFFCSFTWYGMLVFDLVPFFILSAWCQNREASSVS